MRDNLYKTYFPKETMRKRGFDLLVFLSVIVFVSINISALSFTVQNGACTSAEVTVMRLSDTTNAHGELWDQSNYGTYVCYTDPGTHICDQNMTNKVIGLSNYTNAHGEIPENNNYLGNNVCFGDLRCENFTGSCSDPSYTLEMISLSGSTNAHIGNFGNYNTKICCADIEIPYSYWTTPDWTRTNSLPLVIPGTTKVGLVFKNAGVGTGGTVEFQVEKKIFGIWLDFTDTLRNPIVSDPSIDGSDEARTLWTIPETIGDPGKEVTLQFNSEGITSEDNLVITLSDNPDYCKDNEIDACSNYADAQNCANDPCDVIEDSLAGLVDCTLDNIDCFCSFNTPDCEATWTSSTITDEIKIIDETCTIEIPEDGKDKDGCADGKIEFEYEKWCDGVKVDSGKSGYACPAEVQLPFFGFYNFVATMLVIALIYYFMFSHQNKKRK